MKELQLISFEITNRCNLSAGHPWCPSNRPERYADYSAVPMSDDMIFRFAMAAQAVGFKGRVALHYFNEPTLDMPRCERIAAIFRTLNIGVLLWTNGTYKRVPADTFADVFVTEYGAECEGKTHDIPYRPDGRIHIYDTAPGDVRKPCYRPRTIEMPINYFGDVRMCCGDWRGDVRVGNIMRDSHADILAAWIDVMDKAERCEHEVCQRCVMLAHSPVLEDKEYRVWG